MRYVLLFLACMGYLQAEEAAVAPLFSQRYSGYSFDPSKEPSRAQVLALFEAARLSPSSYNEQPWYIIACQRSHDPEIYKKVLETLVPANRKWAQEAPLLLVIIASMHSSYHGKWNRWAAFDTGAAAMSLALEASYLGLITHQIGGFDEGKIRRLFHLPAKTCPLSVMAIGYPSPTEKQTKRIRKDLKENFFESSWNQGFTLDE